MGRNASGTSTLLRRLFVSTSPGRWLGWIGAIALALFAMASLLSLPYTLGRAPVAAAVVGTEQGDFTTAVRRFEATDLDLSLLPPFWARHAADEMQRLAAVEQSRSVRPRPLLGTDRLGRDLFIRLLAGGGISLLIGISAAAIAVVIGVLYGTISAWVGGRTDAVMMRTVDVLFGLPTVLLVVLLAVAVDGVIERSGAALSTEQRQAAGIITLLVAIGGVSWLTMARVIRGQVLSLKQQPFMEACRAIGVPLPRQFFRHLLPNLTGPIVVYATLAVPTAILSESFLSFLGIGVREPLPSWGNLASAGLSEMNIVRSRWWLLFWPCLFIAMTLLGLNFVGESLRARLDPRASSPQSKP